MRLLGVVRLSVLTDESTSPERQRESITHTALARGDDLVGTAEDLDVSGAVSPFQRPGLGPWLTDPAKVSQWDGLVIAKLDRLTRSLADFDQLRRWCDKHGKTIISISESLDLSTSTGRMFANLLAMFAQFERERMSERRREAAIKIRSAAKWNGGHIPYGYKPETNGQGFDLVPDEDRASIIQRIADAVIEGKSVNSVCRDLTANGIPSPQGKARWNPQTLFHILRSPVLKGWVTTLSPDGKSTIIVRDTEGSPVTRPGVLSPEVWDEVQVALDKGTQKRSGRRSDASPLLRVAYCGLCGSPMYALRSEARQRFYYVCQKAKLDGSCKARSIPMAQLEDTVAQSFLAEFGDKPMLKLVSHPGNANSREREELGKRIAQLTTERFVQQVVRPDYDQVMKSLQARYDELSSIPDEPGEDELIDTGKTLGQHWAALNSQARGKMLRDIPLRLLTARKPDDSIVMMWTTVAGETDEGVLVSRLPEDALNA